MPDFFTPGLTEEQLEWLSRVVDNERMGRPVEEDPNQLSIEDVLTATVVHEPVHEFGVAEPVGYIAIPDDPETPYEREWRTKGHPRVDPRRPQ